MSELNACSIVIILLTERENVTNILTILLMHHYLAFACAKCMCVRKQCGMCPKHRYIIVFAGVLSIALRGPIHLSIISLAVSISSGWSRIALMYGLSCSHTWKRQTFSVSGRAFCTYFQQSDINPHLKSCLMEYCLILLKL